MDMTYIQPQRINNVENDISIDQLYFLVLNEAWYETFFISAQLTYHPLLLSWLTVCRIVKMKIIDISKKNWSRSKDQKVVACIFTSILEYLD